MHVESPGVGGCSSPHTHPTAVPWPPKEPGRREGGKPTKDGEDSVRCPAWFCPHCLLQFCSKMLGPRWFYLQTPLTLSPQRRKHLAPRCPFNDSISVFKKVNVGGEERKEKLRSQPVHDTVLTAGFGVFYCLLFLMAFHFFPHNENVHFSL